VRQHVDTGTTVTLINRPGVPTIPIGCGVMKSSSLPLSQRGKPYFAGSLLPHRQTELLISR